MMHSRRTFSRALVSLFSLTVLGPVVGSTALVGSGCLHGTSAALSVEATPAEFSLPSTVGILDSRAALAQGPLVLIFYRGHW